MLHAAPRRDVCALALLSLSSCEWVLDGVPREPRRDAGSVPAPSRADPDEDDSDEPPDDGGTAQGPRDAGPRADAGAPRDAGGRVDAGDGEPEDAADLDEAGSSPSDETRDCDASATWFRDRDGDGVGGAEPADCTPEGSGIAPSRGDCDDDNPLVFPGQTSFFGEPYLSARLGIESFDYDCSGEENGSGRQPFALNSCSLLGSLVCVDGSGYLATARSGVAVNPFCGSRATQRCSVTAVLGLSCAGSVTLVDEPFRCR